MKKYVKQILLTLLTALAIGLSVMLTACNVTRTVTTTSSSVKRGDTTSSCLQTVSRTVARG